VAVGYQPAWSTVKCGQAGEAEIKVAEEAKTPPRAESL